MRKKLLWDWYLDSDCVIDQFVMPALGGVAFEAMSMRRRVITRINEAVVATFFGATPPLFNAATVEEIEGAMRRVIGDPDDKAGVGQRAGAWIERYHSAKRIVGLQVEAYRRLVENGN